MPIFQTGSACFLEALCSRDTDHGFGNIRGRGGIKNVIVIAISGYRLIDDLAQAQLFKSKAGAPGLVDLAGIPNALAGHKIFCVCGMHFTGLDRNNRDIYLLLETNRDRRAQA